MESHQLINQTSGKTDWYTPIEIIEAARDVLGEIDLDPASDEYGNSRVKARRYYSVEDDGLSKTWRGRVWMNHPFARGENKKWINKFLREADEGICITFAATSEAWFKPLLHYSQCFLVPRTQYELADGTVKRGVTKGSVVTYTGSNIAAFASRFGSLGVVHFPAKYFFEGMMYFDGTMHQF